MMTVNIDLGADIETRLAEFALAQEISIADAIKEAVIRMTEAVPNPDQINGDDCPPECRGEPSLALQESFAAYERGEFTRFNTVAELMADLRNAAARQNQ
ncbi:MAG: hypothetical protein QM537_06445 [Candidatus Symbiobacter sp.]|nr:hypothetical protein [Candidatus Symbiobacter sp.]